MARAKQEPKQSERTRLLVPLEQARERVRVQLDRGEAVPNQSINENEEASRWYEFTSELLRQISSTDELRDELAHALSGANRETLQRALDLLKKK